MRASAGEAPPALRLDDAEAHMGHDAVETFWPLHERTQWLSNAKRTDKMPPNSVPIVCVAHECPGRLRALEPGLYTLNKYRHQTLATALQSMRTALTEALAASMSDPDASALPNQAVTIHLYLAASGGSPLDLTMSIETLAERHLGSDGFVHILASTLNAKEVEEERLAKLAERADLHPSSLESPPRPAFPHGPPNSRSPNRSPRIISLPPLTSAATGASPQPGPASTQPHLRFSAQASPVQKPLRALSTSTSLPEMRFRPARQRLAVERRGEGIAIQLREAMRHVSEVVRRSPTPLHSTLSMWEIDSKGGLSVHQLTGALIQLCVSGELFVSFRPSDIRVIFEELAGPEGSLNILEFEKQLRRYASSFEQEPGQARLQSATGTTQQPPVAAFTTEADLVGTVWSMQEMVSFFLSQGSSYWLAQALIKELSDKGDARITRKEWFDAMDRVSQCTLEQPDVLQSALRLEAITAPVKAPRRENFADLRKLGRGAPIRIEKIEERAILLKQLQIVIRHMDRRCFAEEWHMQSSEKIRPQSITFYDTAAYVIRPATMQHGCSLVEFMSTNGAAQLPDYVVSHWWGDSVRDVQACLTQHARDRQLDLKNSAYWLLSFAQSLWKSSEYLALDPSDTPFHRALELAQGMVSVIDRKAVAFSRIWCCYEMSVALEFAAADDADHLDEHDFKYDMYTCLPHGGAAGITDGLAACDERDDSNKDEREQNVPSSTFEAAFEMKIEHGESNNEGERQRILNMIAGRSPDEPPLKAHYSYNMVISRLFGRLLPRFMRTALARGGPTFRAWLGAQRGSFIRRYRQSFVKTQLSPEGCQEILVHMPEGLVSLTMNVPLTFLPEVKQVDLQPLRGLQTLCLAGSLWLEVLPLWLGSLTALKKLILTDCSRLQSLPDEKVFRKLIAMELLDLTGCHGLFRPDLRGMGGNTFGFVNYSTRRGVDMLISMARKSSSPLKVIDAHGLAMRIDEHETGPEPESTSVLSVASSSGRATGSAPPVQPEGRVAQCNKIHKRLEHLMSKYEEEPEMETAAEEKERWERIEATWGKTAPDDSPDGARLVAPSASMPKVSLAPDTKASGKKRSAKAKGRQAAEIVTPSGQAEWLKWFSEREDERERVVAELMNGLRAL